MQTMINPMPSIRCNLTRQRVPDETDPIMPLPTLREQQPRPAIRRPYEREAVKDGRSREKLEKTGKVERATLRRTLKLASPPRALLNPAMAMPLGRRNAVLLALALAREERRKAPVGNREPGERRGQAAAEFGRAVEGKGRQ